jgi:hypothetical protein
MATFRVRFKLNPGRTGIALGKLSKQTENIELFLRSLAADLGEQDKPNLWLGKGFREGSHISTAEFPPTVDEAKVERFDEAIISLSKFRLPGIAKAVASTLPAYLSAGTLERFASLREGLDVDEQIGISTFDRVTGKAKPWRYIDKAQLAELSASIEVEIKYVGAVMGKTYEWNKGADKPYLVVRELNTGELIKCGYADSDYQNVAELFKHKDALVIVQGSITFNRVASKTEVTMATDFEVAPDLSDKDFEAFFGCAPDMTGSLTAAEFIAKGRRDA